MGSVVQVLVVRVDIEGVIYEAILASFPENLFIVVKVDIGLLTYEAMTLQCGSSVVQVLVVSVGIEVLIYEAMAPSQFGRLAVQVPLSKWI